MTVGQFFGAGCDFLEQGLTLIDQVLGLLLSDRLATEGRAFQQSSHGTGNCITTLVPARDPTLQTGIGLVVGRVTRQRRRRNRKTAAAQLSERRIDLFVDTRQP